MGPKQIGGDQGITHSLLLIHLLLANKSLLQLMQSMKYMKEVTSRVGPTLLVLALVLMLQELLDTIKQET